VLPKRLVMERTIALQPYSGSTYTPPYPYPLYTPAHVFDAKTVLVGNVRAVKIPNTSTSNFGETFMLFHTLQAPQYHAKTVERRPSHMNVLEAGAGAGGFLSTPMLSAQLLSAQLQAHSRASSMSTASPPRPLARVAENEVVDAAGATVTDAHDDGARSSRWAAPALSNASSGGSGGVLGAGGDGFADASAARAMPLPPQRRQSLSSLDAFVTQGQTSIVSTVPTPQLQPFTPQPYPAVVAAATTPYLAPAGPSTVAPPPQTIALPAAAAVATLAPLTLPPAAMKMPTPLTTPTPTPTPTPSTMSAAAHGAAAAAGMSFDAAAHAAATASVRTTPPTTAVAVPLAMSLESFTSVLPDGALLAALPGTKVAAHAAHTAIRFGDPRAPSPHEGQPGQFQFLPGVAPAPSAAMGPPQLAPAAQTRPPAYDPFDMLHPPAHAHMPSGSTASASVSAASTPMLEPAPAPTLAGVTAALAALAVDVPEQPSTFPSLNPFEQSPVHEAPPPSTMHARAAATAAGGGAGPAVDGAYDPFASSAAPLSSSSAHSSGSHGRALLPPPVAGLHPVHGHAHAQSLHTVPSAAALFPGSSAAAAAAAASASGFLHHVSVAPPQPPPTSLAADYDPFASLGELFPGAAAGAGGAPGDGTARTPPAVSPALAPTATAAAPATARTMSAPASGMPHGGAAARPTSEPFSDWSSFESWTAAPAAPMATPFDYDPFAAAPVAVPTPQAAAPPASDAQPYDPFAAVFAPPR
jgi:hypothetical protein